MRAAATRFTVSFSGCEEFYRSDVENLSQSENPSAKPGASSRQHARTQQLTTGDENSLKISINETNRKQKVPVVMIGAPEAPGEGLHRPVPGTIVQADPGELLIPGQLVPHVGVV
jgi:hypothetical protein